MNHEKEDGTLFLSRSFYVWTKSGNCRGVNEDDALLSARELLGCVLCGLEEDGEPIPQPTQLCDIKMQPNERVVLVDVYMPSVRERANNRSVNRTVTLPAWLNAAALERNINFSQVLQDALMKKVQAG